MVIGKYRSYLTNDTCNNDPASWRMRQENYTFCTLKRRVNTQACFNKTIKMKSFWISQRSEGQLQSVAFRLSKSRTSTFYTFMLSWFFGSNVFIYSATLISFSSVYFLVFPADSHCVARWIWDSLVEITRWLLKACVGVIWVNRVL